MSKKDKSKKLATVPPAELDRYCKRTRPVIVRNNTSTVLMLSFSDGPREHVVKVPNGTAPFCVSNYVPHALIANNTTFRRLLAETRLELLDYHTVDMSNVVQARTDSFHPEDDEDAAQNVSVEITQEAIPASPQVGYLVASVDVGEMKPLDFITRLEGIQNSLTDRDLLYINDQLGHKYRKVREWATEQLADIRENHPERCLGKESDTSTDGERVHRKLSRRNREVLEEAEKETAAFAADGEGKSPKEKVREQIAKAREGVGEIGSAKERAKKMLEEAAAKRATARRHASEF
jgi:hypothetical protein